MIFDFNFYSSLLLPSFIQCIVFTIIFFTKEHRQQKISDYLIGSILLVIAMKTLQWMLGFAGWYDSKDGYSMFMFYFPFNLLIFIGPLLYFYFRSATNVNFKFKRIDLKHFYIPFAFLLIYFLIAFFDFTFNLPFEEGDKGHGGTIGPLAQLPITQILSYFSYFSLTYYSVLIYNDYKKYQVYLNETFSSIEEINFVWLYYILIIIIGGSLLFFFGNIILLFFDFKNIYKVEWYLYFIYGLIGYYVSISAFKYSSKDSRKLNFEDVIESKTLINDEDRLDNKDRNILESEILIKKEEIFSPETTNSTVLNENLDNLKNKVTLLLEEKQLFLDPEFNLYDFSKLLDTNTTTLSKVINAGFNVNFNELINEYRIKHFIMKLENKEYEIKTLLSLAFESGFNSKATFNRAFKRTTDLSPKEFIEKMPI
jgi:AraC-like DNA-binding protein